MTDQRPLAYIWVGLNARISLLSILVNLVQKLGHSILVKFNIGPVAPIRFSICTASIVNINQLVKVTAGCIQGVASQKFPIIFNILLRISP